MTTRNNEKIKAIKLTISQCSTLICYLLMTTQYRKNEVETWRELSKKVNKDGTPKYIHAESNARFWKKMHEDLEVIRNIIEEN